MDRIVPVPMSLRPFRKSIATVALSGSLPDKLEAEQRRSKLQADPIDQMHAVERAIVARADELEGQAGCGGSTRREPGRRREPLEATASEKPEVHLVEDSRVVVVESSGRNPQPRVPMRKVRHGRDHAAVRLHTSAYVEE